MAMKLNKRAIVIVGLLVLLTPAGCAMVFWSIGKRLSKPKIDFNQPMHFYVYLGGAITHSGDLSLKSPVRTKLGRLLNDDEAKWKKSAVTYVPGIALRAEEYSITLQETTIVLNYKDAKSGAIQVTRDLPEGVFTAIEADLTREK